MTTVSIFQPEITDLEAQINAFQARLAELQQAEFIAQGAMQALTGALAEFEKLGALPKFKSAVLSLLGGSPSPEPTPGKDIHNPDTLEVVQAADNPKLRFEDFVTEVAPKQLTIEEVIESAIADNELPASPSTTEQQLDKLEEELAGEQMNYTELRHLTSTLAYFRKYDGEIQAAYLGCNSKKLADAWVKQLILWGCDAEARKAKRLQGEGISYEVKIRKIDGDRLEKLASYTRESFRHPDVIASEGRPPKKSSAPTEATTSSESLETQNDAIAEKPSEKPSAYKPRVGDLVKVSDLTGQYRIITLTGGCATLRRTSDQVLIQWTYEPGEFSLVEEPVVDDSLKVGDKVRIAGKPGEYRICTIVNRGKSATLRRIPDDFLLTGIALTDCTLIDPENPQIRFAYRQLGDAISPDYEVFLEEQRIGKVWQHLAADGWNHSLNRSNSLSWADRELAALALHASWEANRQTHQSTNDTLRAKYGLAG